jgi:NAD(P)-dependent dehydrogenase (short-subunit alcohol dehydrogenase family)
MNGIGVHLIAEKKVIVITGGTGGIGFQSAAQLAELGHCIVITGRNKQRGEEAVERLRSESGNDDVHLMIGDLSEPANIPTLASQLIEKFPRIDVLVNNAGYLPLEHKVNSLGLEQSFATNVVAPILMTNALLPSLRAGAPSRVINLTGGLTGSALDINNLNWSKKFSTLGVYNNSKRAMEAATFAQARMLEKEGVFLNLVFPGVASTTMTRGMTPKVLPFLLRPLWPLFSAIMLKNDGGKSAKKASRSTVWAVDAPELHRRSGLYHDMKIRKKKLTKLVNNTQNQEIVLTEVMKVREQIKS